ncbi:MAG: M48 family metallopeptidase [Gammaproteobacteria bacterium]|nr:M48 family metallopeptidase [Gammaproteobacteria bacterium]
MSVEATYYDGRSSAARTVRLDADAQMLWLDAEGLQRRWPWDRVSVSERLGGAPRLLRFGDGTLCEVRDGAAFDRLLRRAGRREPWLARWYANRRALALTVAGAVLVLTAGYRWGLPWLAAWLARETPPALSAHISDYTLRTLDRTLLKPSRWSQDDQRALQARVAALRWPDHVPVRCRLVFRDGGKLGANAFALPDGRVVLLDGLLQVTAGDDQRLAVIAHELGHLRYRHGLRKLLQDSVIGLFAAWAIGDVSPLTAAAPAALVDARYSRAFELQADDYAAALLRINGLSPLLLAQVLQQLQRRKAEGGAGGGWLAQHPATAERVRRLGDR